MPPDYLITIDPKSDDRRERLIRAKNKAQAIAHVVADTLQVDVATSDDVLRVGRANGEIEIAKAEA